ncbi:MAG: hypothetical protein ABMB14_33965, partial [Myxococcota bacterium]
MPTGDTVDLEIARELVRNHGADRHTLERKLKDRYGAAFGATLWALWREGALDVSADNGWWREMDDAVDAYTAADVGALLLAASRHPTVAGLRSNWASNQDGWNIYPHCLVRAKIADPAPLVAAWRAMDEPMKAAFGLELVAYGALAAAELSPASLPRLARDAVQQVGSQDIAERIRAGWPVEVAAAALIEAASTPGARLWNLSFLDGIEGHLTADRLASIALNIDYRSVVDEALAVLDRYPDPDGLAAAIVARHRAHGAREFGITTALGWLARRAAAAGTALPPDLGEALLDGLNTDVGPELACAMLAGVAVDRREQWVLTAVAERYDGVAYVPAAVTDRTAAAAVAWVSALKRGRTLPGLDRVCGAIAKVFPALIADASGTKAAQRVWFVHGLGQATDPVVIPAVVRALGDAVAEVRDAAIAAAAAGPFADAIVALARASKKRDVRDAADVIAARVSPAPPVPDPIAVGPAVTEDESDAFDVAWRRVRYGRDTVEVGVAAFVDAHGDRALALSDDGLFRETGETTLKLGWWRAVAERAPIDAATAALGLRMVAGFPPGDDEDGYDDSADAHDAAIEAYYQWYADRYGALGRSAVATLLDDPPAGWHRMVAYAYAQGWDEVGDRLVAAVPTGDLATLALALTRVGARALPGIAAR